MVSDGFSILGYVRRNSRISAVQAMYGHVITHVIYMYYT